MYRPNEFIRVVVCSNRNRRTKNSAEKRDLCLPIYTIRLSEQASKEANRLPEFLNVSILGPFTCLLCSAEVMVLPPSASIGKHDERSAFDISRGIQSFKDGTRLVLHLASRRIDSFSRLVEGPTKEKRAEDRKAGLREEEGESRVARGGGDKCGFWWL